MDRKKTSCVFNQLCGTFVLVAAVYASAFSQTHETSVPYGKSVRSPAEVVLAYVDAANRNDLELFLSFYAPNIKKYRFPATLASEGIEHMRKVYTKSFSEKSGIHIEVKSMIALSDKVICYDHVTGLPNGEEADETVVYQIENGLITNMFYIDRAITTGNRN